MNNASTDEEFNRIQDHLGMESHELGPHFTINVVPAASMPPQPPHEDGAQHIPENDVHYWDPGHGDHMSDLGYFSSGSDVESLSPSTSFQDFPLSPDIDVLHNETPILHSDINSPNSQYHIGQHHWPEALSSPEFLHPGARLRHSRSHSTESGHSFRSNGSGSSAAPYLTPSSSAHSSMENLLLESLDISGPKGGQHSTLSLPDGSMDLRTEKQFYYVAGMSTSSSNGSTSAPISVPHQTYSPAFSSSSGVPIRDMLALLTESGSPITERDPDLIRKAFIRELENKGGRGNGINDFSKPTKMEIGTSATLKASQSRRKSEPSFFCDLCRAGFTRKNGLINHYRSHLGIADKHCKYCHRGFTTSLTRHEKKCKSNPNRVKSP